MQNTRIGRLVIMLAALLLTGSTGALPVAVRAQSMQPPQSPQQATLTINATPAEQQAALGRWTREARLAAKPLPMPAGAADKAAPQAEPQVQLGQAGAVPGGAPQAGAQQAAREQFPEEWRLLEELAGATPQAEPLAGPVPFGTAGVYTSYLGNFYTQMHTAYPYVAVGKLYVGGGWCSASVISPNNIIVTAAHCVYNTDTNTWLTGWVFVPADRNGAAPYGSFPWSSATVLGGWTGAADSLAGRAFDVALIRLGNNSVGNPVTAYTGWLGRAWDGSYVQNLHAIGYPSNLNSGRYTYICTAESFYQAADILGMGCNMMHGSSGGPWILGFTPYAASGNWVYSVVSGGLFGPTWGNTFYGPRFSSSNIVPLCTTFSC
ncbi:MAG TPA: trypsin-like serine protease [Roseiflexaceae bacterium]|nr:trypsin-like serine protease [Roseiflexaceae bacterium]